MSLYPSPLGLPPIPDDLTIPQFLLDSRHITRPYNTASNPWFIEEATGRSIGFEEVCRISFYERALLWTALIPQVRTRTYGLANAISSRWRIGTWTENVFIMYHADAITMQEKMTLVRMVIR